MAALNQRSLQPGERIRVLIVDDSVVIRRLVAHALEEDSAIEVVGAAANGPRIVDNQCFGHPFTSVFRLIERRDAARPSAVNAVRT